VTTKKSVLVETVEFATLQCVGCQSDAINAKGVERRVLADWYSFDEFLERTLPEWQRKAYYLMAILEQLPRIRKRELELIGRRSTSISQNAKFGT